MGSACPPCTAPGLGVVQDLQQAAGDSVRRPVQVQQMLQAVLHLCSKAVSHEGLGLRVRIQPFQPIRAGLEAAAWSSMPEGEDQIQALSQALRFRYGPDA